MKFLKVMMLKLYIGLTISVFGANFIVKNLNEYGFSQNIVKAMESEWNEKKDNSLTKGVSKINSGDSSNNNNETTEFSTEKSSEKDNSVAKEIVKQASLEEININDEIFIHEEGDSEGLIPNAKFISSIKEPLVREADVVRIMNKFFSTVPGCLMICGSNILSKMREVKSDFEAKKITNGAVESKDELDFAFDFRDALRYSSEYYVSSECLAKTIVNNYKVKSLSDLKRLKKKDGLELYVKIKGFCRDNERLEKIFDKLSSYSHEDIPSLIKCYKQWNCVFTLILRFIEECCRDFVPGSVINEDSSKKNIIKFVEVSENKLKRSLKDFFKSPLNLEDLYNVKLGDDENVKISDLGKKFDSDVDFKKLRNVTKISTTENDKEDVNKDVNGSKNDVYSLERYKECIGILIKCFNDSFRNQKEFEDEVESVFTRLKLKLDQLERFNPVKMCEELHKLYVAKGVLYKIYRMRPHLDVVQKIDDEKGVGGVKFFLDIVKYNINGNLESLLNSLFEQDVSKLCAKLLNLAYKDHGNNCKKDDYLNNNNNIVGGSNECEKFASKDLTNENSCGKILNNLGDFKENVLSLRLFIRRDLSKFLSEYITEYITAYNRVWEVTGKPIINIQRDYAKDIAFMYEKIYDLLESSRSSISNLEKFIIKFDGEISGEENKKILNEVKKYIIHVKKYLEDLVRKSEEIEMAIYGKFCGVLTTYFYNLLNRLFGISENADIDARLIKLKSLIKCLGSEHSKFSSFFSNNMPIFEDDRELLTKLAIEIDKKLMGKKM